MSPLAKVLIVASLSWEALREVAGIAAAYGEKYRFHGGSHDQYSRITNISSSGIDGVEIDGWYNHVFMTARQKERLYEGLGVDGAVRYEIDSAHATFPDSVYKKAYPSLSKPEVKEVQESVIWTWKSIRDSWDRFPGRWLHGGTRL